jgi:aminodeoxyfutalosine deaminase
MNPSEADRLIAALPKAELHLHLEGAIEPATAVELAARHGVRLTPEEVDARYSYVDFLGFLEAFKWVTSFLRDPADYALITERHAERLLQQNVRYAEVTLSIGVMLLRKQDAEANFAAIHEAAGPFERKGLKLRWVFDAARQFGHEQALEVARLAARLKSKDVVAFGMGGDELAAPAEAFRAAYDHAAAAGLHRLMHAGEIGGPKEIRDAVELLGVERIGHGIAVMHDRALAETLARAGVSLEICPTSNLRTGALARQLGRAAASAEDHPVRSFLEHGPPFTLSTDDPAMFQTTLLDEYSAAQRMGFAQHQLADVAEASFVHSFLPEAEKRELLSAFSIKRAELGLA